jgi:uncharacterized protein (DUF2062 family)
MVAHHGGVSLYCRSFLIRLKASMVRNIIPQSLHAVAAAVAIGMTSSFAFFAAGGTMDGPR